MTYSLLIFLCLFKERHKAYGDVIDDLNVIFETLNEKGTGQVTIGAMKYLIQSKTISIISIQYLI